MADSFLARAAGEMPYSGAAESGLMALSLAR